MKPRFLDFTQLALLVHGSDFTPATREMVARKLGQQLTRQYPAFNLGTFITTAVTGVVQQLRSRRRRPLTLGAAPLLPVAA